MSVVVRRVVGFAVVLEAESWCYYLKADVHLDLASGSAEGAKSATDLWSVVLAAHHSAGS